MPRSNWKLTQLSRWAADPALMARFEAVALLCQRTLFVRNFLCLTDPEALVREQIKLVCERNGVKCVQQRGKSFGGIHVKSLTPIQRYHASFLMATLNASTSGGLNMQQGIEAGLHQDKLIFAYHRYLQNFKQTAGNAEVSFERFIFIRDCCLTGEVDTVICANCEAQYISLRVGNFTCPFCAAHSHAVIPRGRTGMLTRFTQSADNLVMARSA